MFHSLLWKIISALSLMGVSSSNVSAGDVSAADVSEAVSATDLSPYAKLFEDKATLITVVTATGILVVFFALIILIVLFSLFGVVFGGKKKKKPAAAPKAAAPAAPASAAAPAAPVQQGISGEVVAAIAAAVASMEGGSDLVIRSVRRAAQPQGRPAWSNAGILENTRPF